MYNSYFTYFINIPIRHLRTDLTFPARHCSGIILTQTIVLFLQSHVDAL